MCRQHLGGGGYRNVSGVLKEVHEIIFIQYRFCLNEVSGSFSIILECN